MADPSEVEGDEPEHEVQPARKDWRKELTAQAKAAEDRAAELERKLAFSEAELNHLNDKQRKAIFANLEGEVSAESVKAIAKELGLPTKAKMAEDADPEQAAREREVSELSRFAGGAQPEGTGVMTADEVVDKIHSFDSPEALREYMLANPDLFSSGAPTPR